MKSRPSLFEAINKAPQTHEPARRGGLSRLWGRSEDSSAPVVAEAMTEEEAAAELAARREAAEADARAKADKRQAKEERKAAKQAARQAAREAAARLDVARAGQPPESQPVRLMRGRLVLSLNTAGCIVAAACVCLVSLGSYGLGVRSANDGPVSELAAKVGGDQDAGGMLPSNDASRANGNGASAPHRGDADLSALLQSPSERSGAVKPNQPASVVAAPAVAGLSEALNYLEVQYFQITRDTSSEDLLRDLADVRRYLADSGIETFARRHPKGFLLYTTKGYRMSSDAKEARRAFIDKIEGFGQAYRQAGGRYSFKGCYFVSHARATSGRPL